jgi:Zn-dependent peptidase ImmA (M78 family)/transcriptional regulator with XRE-family HTH domain
MTDHENERGLPVGPGDLHLAAHRFQGVRLSVARELRGLTRVDLADRIGKTASAISQFEGGRSRPDSKTLAAMALVLGIPVGFFARPDCRPLSLEACHFRTLRSASQRERRKLLSIGTLLSELVETLEEHVELPPERVSTAAQSLMAHEDIERCAQKVRGAWGLGQGPIPNVVKLLQSKGVIVCIVPNTCREVDAFSAWHAGRPLVFLVGDRRGSRMRFDAGHELGHLIMHADVTPGGHEVERQAHRFSAAFLVPRDSFLQEWPRWLNWDQIFELKRRWGLSAAALVRRAFDLGALSEASYRRANIRLKQYGPDEPSECEAEYPTLLTRSLDLLEGDVTLERLAAAQGIGVRDLEALVRGERLDDALDAPPVLDEQLSLLSAEGVN